MAGELFGVGWLGEVGISPYVLKPMETILLVFLMISSS